MPTMNKIRQRVLASGTRNTSGVTNSISIDDSDIVDVVVSVTAKGGSSPTLDVQAQTSDDDDLTYMDIPDGAVPQMTDIGREFITISSGIMKYIKFAYTIGGSSPSFTFDIYIIKRNKF